MRRRRWGAPITTVKPPGSPSLVEGEARAIRAAWNRAEYGAWDALDKLRRYAPCYVMLSTDPAREIWLDAQSETGEWRGARGGAIGEDLIGLGAYMWACSRGRAAHRISRACGHGELPHVGDLAGH